MRMDMSIDEVEAGVLSAHALGHEADAKPPDKAARARITSTFQAAAESFDYDLRVAGYFLEKQLALLEDQGIAAEPYISCLCSNEAAFDAAFAMLAPPP